LTIGDRVRIVNKLLYYSL